VIRCPSTSGRVGVEFLDFTALNQAKYELAISNDIPLIDIFGRFTSYAVSNPLGLYNDSAHPSAAGYADKGAAIFRALA
jgi:lysophospholipase L1-like esterase